MNIPKYPDDFFDFKTGGDISNEEINEWIRSCVKDLEEDKNQEYSYTACGNTQVAVFRKFYEDKPELNSYEVMVTKNYQEADIWLKENK